MIRALPRCRPHRLDGQRGVRRLRRGVDQSAVYLEVVSGHVPGGESLLERPPAADAAQAGDTTDGRDPFLHSVHHDAIDAVDHHLRHRPAAEGAS